MGTKADVIKYIRKNYQSRDLESGALAPGFNLPSGRDHQVIVHWNNEEGSFTKFFGFVCEWSPDAAARVLEENNSIFGVAKIGNWVAIQQSQLTETIDEEEIDRALFGVANIADELEQQITGDDQF